MGEEETAVTANNLESKVTSDTTDGYCASLPSNDGYFVDDASQNSYPRQLKEKQEVSQSSVSSTTGREERPEASTAQDTSENICGGIGKHHDVATVERNEVDVKMSNVTQTTATGGGSAANTTTNATATANAATAKGSSNNTSAKHIDGQLRSPPSKSRHLLHQHQMTYPLTQGYHHPHHHTHHPYAYSHHPAYHHPHHPAAYHHHSTTASFHHPPTSALQSQGASSTSSAPTSSQQHHWSNTTVQHAYSGYYKAYHHHQQLHHHHQQQQSQPHQAKMTAEPSNISSNNSVAKKNQPTKDESSVDCDRQHDDADRDASNDQCEERDTKCSIKKRNTAIEDESAILGGDIREAKDKNGNEEESSSVTETVMNEGSYEENVIFPEDGDDDAKDTGCDITMKKKAKANRPDTIASSASISSVMGVGATASWNSQSDNDNVQLSLATSSSTLSKTTSSKQQHPSHPTATQYHTTHYGWHHAASAHHVSRGYHQYHFQQQHGYHPYHLQQHPQHSQSSQHQSQLFPQYHHPYWPGYGGHSQHNLTIAATSSSSHHPGRSTLQQDIAGAQPARETLGTCTIETTEQRPEKMKKRNRNEPSTMITEDKAEDDARDDLNTNESFLSDEYYCEYDGDNAYKDNERNDNIHCTEEDDDDTATTEEGGLGSLAGISFDSLESSPKGKRRKGPHKASYTSSSLIRRSQSIHRTKPTGQLQANVDANEDEDDTKLLEVSSTFSDGGKMILKNLSIHSNYSAELAELCGPSPMNAAIDSHGMEMKNDGTDNEAEGRTPKKRNTTDKRRKQKGAGMGPFEFRLDGLTPAPSYRRIVLGPSSSTMNMSHEDSNNDSPTMFDLIGGAETPTTDMLMSNIMEAEMTDDLRCLNGHLRGQTFTPLHVDAGSGHSLVGGTSGDDSPQLSWSTTNGGSPLEITPRCFGLLDSTKSTRSFSSIGGGIGERSHHPLGSPRSFWKDNILDQKGDEGASISESSGRNGDQGGVKSILSILSPTMREMDTSYDGVNDLEVGSRQATSPLPLYYNDGNHGQENVSNPNILKVNTPQRMPINVPSSAGQVSQVQSSPWASDYQHHVRPNSGIAHSPIPHLQHQSHHHGAASPFSGVGPPPPHQGFYHNMMYDHSAHHQHPNDRVRNLRGNGPPRHQMPPQHHLPPPSYHHFSPLTNVTSNGRGDRYGGYPLLPHQLDMLSSSKRKCVPIKHPIPSKFQGDVEKYKDAQIPEFNNLVNFPGHMSNKPSPNVPEGMRCCVMCGQACPCSTGGKSKKPVFSNSVTNFIGTGGSTGGNVAPLGDSTSNNTNKGIVTSSSNTMSSHPGVNIGNYASIPTQNKGLCTICDVNVWLVISSGLEIKWCKGCKNFRPWAAFGDKGLATKCVRCRERQREKYALTKEEKDKKKSSSVREDLHYDNMQQQQVGQAASAIDPPMGYQ